MKLFIVETIPLTGPGRILRACFDMETAEIAAMDMANRLRAEVNLPPANLPPGNWRDALAGAITKRKKQLGISPLDDLTGENAGGIEIIGAETAGKAPTLVIHLDGGMVQDVSSDNFKLANAFLNGIVVIDYDHDGVEPSEITLVKQSDGEYSEAIVREESVCRCDLDIEQIDREQAAEADAKECGWDRTGDWKTAEGFTHGDGRTSDAYTWEELVAERGIADGEESNPAGEEV